DTITARFDATVKQVLVPHLQHVSDVISSQVIAAGQNSQDQARRFTDEMVQQMTGSLQTSFQGMNEQVDAVSAKFADTVGSLERVLASTDLAVESQRAMFHEGQQVLAAAQARSSDA